MTLSKAEILSRVWEYGPKTKLIEAHPEIFPYPEGTVARHVDGSTYRYMGYSWDKIGYTDSVAEAAMYLYPETKTIEYDGWNTFAPEPSDPEPDPDPMPFGRTVLSSGF